MYVLGLVLFVAALTGCAARPVTTSASAPAPSAPAPAEPTPAPEPAVAAAPPAPAAEVATSPAPTPQPNGFVAHERLKDVHFGSGRIDVLRADARILDAVVGWLKENPTALMLIEGHTDELGPREQNLSIGEKRAKSIMKYLVSKGVEADRVAIASYGSDRPVCTLKTEACRAQNRRVRFLVKAR